MELTDFQYENIKNDAIKSINWCYGYSILPKIIPPIVTLILARMLDPSIFGLVAIATLVISLVDMIREVGLSKAFIQIDEDERITFNVVFWLSLTLGVVFYAIVFITAPVIANFFNSTEAASIIQVLGIQMVLSSLGTSHHSLLLRRMNFKELFKINLLPNSTPLLITLPLAYFGMGVWSLVIGYLSSSIIRTFLLWYYLACRPHFEFNYRIGKKFAYFSLLCSQEAVLGWFYVWGDRAIVGHFLDMKQLGIYTIASTVVTTIFSLVFAPLENITYPALCRMKKDLNRLNQTLYKLVSLTGVIALPIGVYIFTFAYFLPILIGENWKGIEIPLGILGIAGSLSWIVTIIIPDTFRAIGRADVMPKFQSAKLLYTLPFFLIGVNYGGLLGFCGAKLVTVIVGFILFLYMSSKTSGTKYEYFYYYLKVPFISAAVMGVILYLLQLFMISIGLNYIILAFVSLFIGIICYIGVFIVFKNNLYKELLKIGLLAFGIEKEK